MGGGEKERRSRKRGWMGGSAGGGGVQGGEGDLRDIALITHIIIFTYRKDLISSVA